MKESLNQLLDYIICNKVIVFFLFTNHQIYESTSGSNWIPVAVHPSSLFFITPVIYIPELESFAVGTFSVQNLSFAIASDVNDWTEILFDMPWMFIDGIAYGNGILVVSGSTFRESSDRCSGVLLSSAYNSVSDFSVTLCNKNNTMVGLVFGAKAGLFVALSGNTIYMSNGTSPWNVLEVSVEGYCNIQYAGNQNGMFYICCQPYIYSTDAEGTYVYTSEDAMTWTMVEDPTGSGVTSSSYLLFSDVFVGTGFGGVLWISNDGQNWKSAPNINKWSEFTTVTDDPFGDVVAVSYLDNSIYIQQSS